MTDAKAARQFFLH